MNENKIKLTEKQIEKINYIKEQYGNISNELGILEMQLFNLENKKLELKTEYMDIQKVESDFLNDIQEEYGEGELNIEENTFTKNG